MSLDKKILEYIKDSVDFLEMRKLAGHSTTFEEQRLLRAGVNLMENIIIEGELKIAAGFPILQIVEDDQKN